MESIVIIMKTTSVAANNRNYERTTQDFIVNTIFVKQYEDDVNKMIAELHVSHGARHVFQCLCKTKQRNSSARESRE